MIRTVWFALSCLVGIAAIAGLKAVSKRDPPKIVEAFEDSEVAPKSDKLEVPELASEIVVVKTSKIVGAIQPGPPAKIPPAKIEPRHWRATYANVRSKKHHHYRHHRHRRSR